MKIADGHQRIFEVIQKSEAKDKIEFAKFANFQVLDVCLFERNMWKAAAGLFHILDSAVESTDAEACVLQNLSKESDTTAGVQRGREIQGWFELVDNTANRVAAGLDEIEVVIRIKLCSRYGFHVDSESSNRSVGSANRSTHPYSVDGFPWRSPFPASNPTGPALRLYPRGCPAIDRRPGGAGATEKCAKEHGRQVREKVSGRRGPT